MNNRYTINETHAKRVIDSYIEKRGVLVSRDELAKAVKIYDIPEDVINQINSFLGASLGAPLNLISMGRGGCVLNPNITMKEAYEAIENNISIKKALSLLGHYGASAVKARA